MNCAHVQRVMPYMARQWADNELPSYGCLLSPYVVLAPSFVTEHANCVTRRMFIQCTFTGRVQSAGE
jgi:hypothetical protein